MRKKIGTSLSEMPLIQRCAVVGWACAGVIFVPVVVALDISEYSSGTVVEATLFGIFEASVAALVIGGGLGLAVGLLAYLSRGAARAARRRRATG
jgi:hypothetical protein